MSDLLTKMPLVYEPLRRNTLILEADGKCFTVNCEKLPAITTTVHEMPVWGKTCFNTGQYEYESLKVEIKECIGCNFGSNAILDWLRESTTESVTGRQGYRSKKDIKLSLISPEGAAIHTWLMRNSSIIKYGYSESYSECEMRPEIEITYDYLEETFGNESTSKKGNEKDNKKLKEIKLEENIVEQHIVKQERYKLKYR